MTEVLRAMLVERQFDPRFWIEVLFLMWAVVGIGWLGAARVARRVRGRRAAPATAPALTLVRPCAGPAAFGEEAGAGGLQPTRSRG